MAATWVLGIDNISDKNLTNAVNIIQSATVITQLRNSYYFSMPNASKYRNYRQELKHLLRARSAVYILVSKQMVKKSQHSLCTSRIY